MKVFAVRRAVLVLIVSLLAATPAVAAPCVNDGASCEEWVSLGTRGGRTLVYRTFPLEVRNAAVTRALIVVHGKRR
jgi:hypothetical protein